MHLTWCEQRRKLVRCEDSHCLGDHSLAKCPTHGTILVYGSQYRIGNAVTEVWIRTEPITPAGQQGFPEGK